MKRFIGIRNIVTSKSDWKRLLFYEIDSHDMNQYLKVKYAFDNVNISYISYQTLNGFHFVGLTPISASLEGVMHDYLQTKVPEYFSGQTLRVSLKEGEKQELMAYSFKYPYMIKTTSMYARRFGIEDRLIDHTEIPKYSAVFERYWTGKI